MCAQYLPPTQLQPIYNPNNFPSIKDNISIEDGNALYIQTGTANQSSQGIKTFNDLRARNFRLDAPSFILGYQPIRWVDNTGTITSQITPLYNGISSSFLLPTYGITTQDTIVAETASQTLTNKTIQSGTLTTASKFGANGTAIHTLRHGSVNITFTNVNQYGQAVTSVAFGFTMNTVPRIYLTMGNANGGAEVATVFHARSVSQTGFSINGMYFFTNSNQTFTVSINWLAICS